MRDGRLHWPAGHEGDFLITSYGPEQLKWTELYFG